MRRLSQDQIGTLRSLSVSDAFSEATAVEAGSTWGSNLWNRLFSGGLVGKTSAGPRPLFWLTDEGRKALVRADKAAEADCAEAA